MERVCRTCQSAVHSRKDCQTWKRLQANPAALAAYERRLAADARLVELQTAQQAQHQQQHQRQHQQHQQQQKQQQHQQQRQQQTTPPPQTRSQEQPAKQSSTDARQPRDQDRPVLHDTTSDIMSDAEFVHSVEKSLALTSILLKDIEDDAQFEAILSRALTEYVEVVGRRQVDLPHPDRLADSWRMERSLALYPDTTDAGERGDLSFTMDEATSGVQETSSDTEDLFGDSHPSTTTILPLPSLVIPASPTEYTGVGEARPGTLSPPAADTSGTTYFPLQGTLNTTGIIPGTLASSQTGPLTRSSTAARRN